jgi:two-component system LytT family sensor kinase
MGITTANRELYRYHVVENDSVELVPWSPVTKLDQQYGARQAYGFLGRFKAPGKTILVEVVNVKDYSIRDGVLFDWRTDLKPMLAQITLGLSRDYFNLAYLERNRHYATRFDPQTGAPLDFAFPVDSVQQMILQFERRETVAYAVYLLRDKEREKDTLSVGLVSQAGQFELDRALYAQPGHYEIRVEPQARVPVWDEAHMIKIPFDVLPPLAGKAVTFRQLVPWMISALVLVALTFAGYRQYSRRKLRKAALQRSMVQLQLKSIRSQLNPHFMFNALGSIQNLMNKNNLLQANLYLAKFAGLTRKVLNTSEQELISLEDELKIVDDYLQMEQLRFGFQYQLQVGENIDQGNTEIPSMLLQPFIENAVKHGIAALKDQGMIIVAVQQKDDDLIFSLQDNGTGFKVKPGESKPSAFGLKLSQERVDLINQVYKEQPVVLQIVSEPGNTTVTLTLTNWS